MDHGSTVGAAKKSETYEVKVKPLLRRYSQGGCGLGVCPESVVVGHLPPIHLDMPNL